MLANRDFRYMKPPTPGSWYAARAQNRGRAVINSTLQTDLTLESDCSGAIRDM